MHLNEVLFTNVFKFTKLLLELQIRYTPASFPLPIIFSSLELSLTENQIVTSPKDVCTNRAKVVLLNMKNLQKNHHDEPSGTEFKTQAAAEWEGTRLMELTG